MSILQPFSCFQYLRDFDNVLNSLLQLVTWYVASKVLTTICLVQYGMIIIFGDLNLFVFSIDHKKFH
jgi:hypothetical protein